MLFFWYKKENIRYTKCPISTLPAQKHNSYVYVRISFLLAANYELLYILQLL